ncbi:RbsD/FucU family protein [Fusibacillus kribbianus]|uniref:D-ribose pyranase n=1 Tax=Fusibacillus kribbianus TaxID=3044208 RepID=A0AAP4F0I4_9FIRM|nr:RbsD/FucU family protein [Ruminococcus sp. YH-rum2234]MDI9243370.1 RbsD/FucU family protein [Ruminococcus sp. YH-rum2234]
MLTTTCIHPGIMKALSLCGHGSKVLIADGNYPLADKSGNAEKVYLGVMPGLPTVTDVLKAVHSVVEIEKAEVMVPGDGTTPEIFKEFEEELGLPLSGVGRFEYYDICCEPNVVLAISTGEKRVFANILLTIGCA